MLEFPREAFTIRSSMLWSLTQIESGDEKDAAAWSDFLLCSLCHLCTTILTLPLKRGSKITLHRRIWFGEVDWDVGSSGRLFLIHMYTSHDSQGLMYLFIRSSETDRSALVRLTCLNFLSENYLLPFFWFRELFGEEFLHKIKSPSRYHVLQCTQRDSQTRVAWDSCSTCIAIIPTELTNSREQFFLHQHQESSLTGILFGNRCFASTMHGWYNHPSWFQHFSRSCRPLVFVKSQIVDYYCTL